jgi:hypothetical protein
MELKENFLPEAYVRDLNSTILSNLFPWYRLNETVSPVYNPIPKDKFTQESVLHVHGLYAYETVNSPHYGLVKPILYFIEETYKCKFNLERIKLNYMYKDSTFPVDSYNTVHSDISNNAKNCKTFLYYLNDSDGDTFFFNEYHGARSVTVKHRQTPVANSGVLFDSDMLHASSPPRTNEYRITINIVLKDFKFL